MLVTVITPPQEPPVSLADAKDFLRIGYDDEDTFIVGLVAAATARVEAAGGESLVRRTLLRRFAVWPNTICGRGFILRPRPVTRLVSVTVIEADGTQSTVTDRFQLFNGRLVLRPWSILPAMAEDAHGQVVYESGFGDAADVPEDLALAVKLAAAEAYRQGDLNRLSDSSLPRTVMDILASRREMRL